jgi:hypothetical protein
VILPDAIKTYLLGRYNRFLFSLDTLTTTTPLAALQAVDARITARLESIVKSPTLPLADEMQADKLRQALLFLQKLVQTEILHIQNVISGAKYTSRDPEQCKLMDYICKPGTAPFTDATGCGCKI